MARVIDAGYEVARPTGRCAATGCAINPGDVYIAALVQPEAGEGLEREDFALAAWEAGARPRPPRRLFGYWRTRMPEPGETRRQFIDDEALLDLFDQLAEATEPGRQAFRFVLALILVRKRLLRYEGARPGYITVRRTRAGGAPADEAGNPAVDVVDPGLDEAALAEATDQLAEIIQGEGNAAAGGGA